MRPGTRGSPRGVPMTRAARAWRSIGCWPASGGRWRVRIDWATRTATGGRATITECEHYIIRVTMCPRHETRGSVEIDELPLGAVLDPETGSVLCWCNRIHPT